MSYLDKNPFLWLSIMVGGLLSLPALATITEINDDFNVGAGNWGSVGSATALIAHDSMSEGDYDDGNLSLKLPYSLGMALPGDGVKSDGGLFLDSQNTIQGDEAMGLTIAGLMEKGEEIIFSGNIYNNRPSYSSFKTQLWNLTDNTVLAESGSQSINGLGHASYVPVNFSVSYTVGANDAGDTLQIRILENANHTDRNVYVDNFSLTSSLNTPPPSEVHPRLFFTTSELAGVQSRRLTTHSNEWAAIISVCDGLKDTSPSTTPRTASGLLNYEDQIVAMALTQLVDPSLPYQATSEDWFWTILNWTEWGEGYWFWPDYGPSGNLETGEILRGLAIWYDLQYHNLSPAERVEASQKLADYADRYRHSYELFWTTEKGRLVGNHCWNAFASLATVYYASDEISPERFTDWTNLLDGHYSTIKDLMNNQLSDGVCGEGSTYWTYGTGKILLWYEMRRMAGKPAFEGIDWFAHAGTYGIYSTLPGGTDNFGGITRFEDANPDYWGNPYNQLALLAKATGDPVAQWMASKLDYNASDVDKYGVHTLNAYRYMFYDPTVPTADPATDLNNWHYFNRYGMFMWRTSWDNAAQHFSIRSGQHSHGHSKCDDGQFMIDRAGVPYIANLGYAVPRYTQDSNVLMVNGTGQYSDGDTWGSVFETTWPNNSNTWGKILHVLANDSNYAPGDFFNILLDPTPMYTNPNLSSWQREVVGLGGDLYLLRDTVSAGTSANFDLLLHAQVTVASGDTFNQDAYAYSNPWTQLATGKWEINARSGSPKMLVQDLSSETWSSSIEETLYYHRYDSTPPTRRGNKLKRSLSGTTGTSLVSFGFEDLMTGWTQAAWSNPQAEGLHIVDSGSPVIDVLWPLNGISAAASDGWTVNGKMAGRRFGKDYFGRGATSIQHNGLNLLSATAPVSLHAKTEPPLGGTVPSRIVIQAAAASTIMVYAPYEPKSVLLDNVDMAFSWANNQLTVSIPATEGSTLDLVSSAYLTWRDQYFTEAEIAAGLAGLVVDADGDHRSNWEEFLADTDPRDEIFFLEVTIEAGTISFGTSSNRLYTVEYATNLTEVSSWILLLEDEPGTGSMMSLVDTNGYNNCFYRIKAGLL